MVSGLGGGGAISNPATTPALAVIGRTDSWIRPFMSSGWISQQNQQLDLAGGCNAINPRDFVVWGSCSIPTAPTNHPIC
jgi:hypothetical protein